MLKDDASHVASSTCQVNIHRMSSSIAVLPYSIMEK